MASEAERTRAAPAPASPPAGPDPVPRWTRLLGLALGIAAVYAGWSLFWFLTDDAFIAFRYVHNAMLGRGLVWNPAPFVPVEGYTSFLWVVLLEWVWKATGVAPPESACWISLLLGYATLAVVYRMAMGMRIPAAHERARTVLVAIAFLGIVSNRTFLTWLSSGLETALFNFLLISWVCLGLAPPASRSRAWTFWLATTSAAMTLARPDGLLFVAAALVLIAAAGRQAGRGEPRGLARWAQALPLVAVPAHLLWRHRTYGEWLPNTYYAKLVAPWPYAGYRYLESFVIEYGVWLWLLLLAAFLAWRVPWRRAEAPAALGRGAHVVVTLGALVAHVGYYTLRVGGDHFEYRVLSHLVPLLFVSALWLATRLARTPPVAATLLIALVVVSWPIPWVHWWQTRGLETREETHVLARPIAQRFPRLLRPAVRYWDGNQRWLIAHHVCMRHQEHKAFFESQLAKWPSRAEGSRISWDQRAIAAIGNVGVPGWVLPNVAIIDTAGLNDRVVSRASTWPTGERLMAHDRMAPVGYLACFRPNLVLTQRARVFIRDDVEPLSDAEIRACEGADWREQDGPEHPRPGASRGPAPMDRPRLRDTLGRAGP